MNQTQVSKVHICLLSDQLLPNLIPILMDRPERVYLIVSNEMEAKGRHKRMRRLLRGEKIESRVRLKAPGTGIDTIRRFAGKLAREIKQEETGKTIVLNATGGTKLLSMGFVEVFRESFEGYSLRVVYTDTQHQRIETLVPRGTEVIPMEGVLQTNSYLAAQGMKLISAYSDKEEWRSAVQERNKLTRYLADNCKELGGFFGAINGIIHGYGNNDHPGVLTPNGKDLSNPEQRFNTNPRRNWRDALNQIKDAGLIRWDSARTLYFETTEAARYLSGHWLEEYAWMVAQAAGLQDVRCSATGQWELQTGAGAPTNEFDLLAVHDNRLLIVECKTGRQTLKEQEITTRLESLNRNAGGLFGTSILLSAREIPETMRNRCRSLGIRYLENGAITKFADYLSKWRDSCVLPALKNT